MKFILLLSIYLLAEKCICMKEHRPTRLKPTILEKLELICRILKDPKEGEQDLLLESIRLLNKTMKKLGGWIEHPRHPERPQDRYINEGCLVVKQSAKFTHMEYDEQALKTVFGWNQKHLETLILLKTDTEDLRTAIYKTCRSRKRKKV